MNSNTHAPGVRTDVMIAYAFRSGHIDFASKYFGHGIPQGALFIAEAPINILGPIIRGLARHAYDGVTLLVSGVPEAADEDEAYDKFKVFFDRVQIALGRHTNIGPTRDRKTRAARVKVQA